MIRIPVGGCHFVSCLFNILLFLFSFVVFSNLISVRLSSFYVFVCVFGYGWRVGMRILRIFPLPGCILGVCVYGNGSIGCTNNNYASREKCKKCGQPKEIAAMPATAIPGASLPTYPDYFARAQGGLEPTISIGLLGNGAPPESLPLNSDWSLAGTDKFGFQPSSSWPVGGTNSSGVVHTGQANQIVATPKGWRSGDWICSCGFHNYSSRAQCKKCNAPVPPAAPSSFVSTAITALGTKRLASEELVQAWDNKRLNAGHSNQPNIMSSNFLGGISAVAPNLQLNVQAPPISAAPTLLGKGAKQWRQGDWMCTNCNNHNYASRSQCNRCKTQREVLAQPVGVA